MPETTPLIKAALNLRVGVGFDVYKQIMGCFVFKVICAEYSVLKKHGMQCYRKITITKCLFDRS